MTKRRVHAEPIPRWRPIEVAVVRLQYPHMLTKTIAALMGHSEKRVWNLAHRLGLKKTPEFFRLDAARRIRLGFTPGAKRNQFPRGNVPHNKGLRRPGWASGRMRETQFKPGERRGIANKVWKPVGTERMSKDGYLERKMNDGLPFNRRWRAVHLIVWEAANGPLPKGHAIVFRDGNKRNLALDNLECISRADLMRRNTYHRYPQPIPQLIQLRGQLQRQINRREGRGKQNRGLEGSPVRNARRTARPGEADGH